MEDFYNIIRECIRHIRLSFRVYIRISILISCSARACTISVAHIRRIFNVPTNPAPRPLSPHLMSSLD